MRRIHLRLPPSAPASQPKPIDVSALFLVNHNSGFLDLGYIETITDSTKVIKRAPQARVNVLNKLSAQISGKK